MKGHSQYIEKPKWMLKRDQIDRQMDDDLVVIQSEFNYRQAAYDAVERVCANHYCPKMPDLKQPNHSEVRIVKV